MAAAPADQTLTVNASATINGTLILGTNDITMTGSIGVTGTRVTKGWFTNLECQNDIIINGAALASIYQPLDDALTNISALTYVSPSFIKLTADDTYAVRTLAETLGDLSGVASGAFSFNDQNITNVGDISLDSISSDAGTSINVVLGSDAGDDFTVDTNKLVVEGDTGYIGIGVTDPSQQLEITKNFELPASTHANSAGIIYKGADRFISDFNYGLNDAETITTNGFNTFVGINAGNFTMGSTATQVYHASYNTGIGYQSFQANTTGNKNTAKWLCFSLLQHHRTP